VICTIIVAIYRNKRKREEAQLNIERMQMEIKQEHELDEMRLKVYTNISHDFKTPLSLILIPLDRLIDETHNPVLLKTLKIMQRNAKQLLELINQLLDFRKLDAGGEQLKLSKDDIVSFIDEVCYGFKELASNKDIKFEIHKEERKLVMLFDKDKVRKIMINLLSNAFKFTPNGGEVSIGIKTVTNNDHADCVQIYVADSGIGIPDEDKTRIFERFFQVDSPQDSSKTGNGIGLHIVKEYTKLMKGSIEVQDRVPKGSVFTITLPVVNETSEDIVEQSATDKEKKEAIAAYDEVVKENQKSTLMLVEDNDDFRSFLIDCLKDEYNLFEASQGKEALAILRENRVDMVISDIMMPVMDGIELCNRIKSDPSISHIPVILLTARSAEEHIKEGLREGADDYITKPFNLDILKLRIKKILDWYKNNHEKFKIVNLAPSEITVSSVDEEFIRQAINTVEDNMDNSEFSVNDLAESVAMSRAQIYRKLPVITGQSPSDFIKLIRLKRAMQLLRSTSMNISEISYKVGLSSPKMLTKYFREEYGISPSEYRRNGDSSFTTVH
jgi:DNA-binding response OmpR family regulator/nitrogen-specific signal transduction histidine kinase